MADLKIALDAMSGDHGPTVVVPAALYFAKRHPEVSLILVGDAAILKELLANSKGYEQLRERIIIHHASEVVNMDDPPAVALRNKKDSSMRVAINLVKDGTASACVSAGNTGALMAIARFVLKMIPGIDRPAICSALPSKQGHTHMMDLGANVNCTSEHLYQFALMGTELVKAIDNIPRPRVALLNIGEEKIKGNDQVKQANQLLNDSDLNYVGYVEGNDIYGDATDVVICDGFVGNVSLKSSEGVATMFTAFLKEEFTRTMFTKFIAILALPVLAAFKRRADPRRYNGASLIGLQGIVIKSHGSADRLAFSNAIKIAKLEVKQDVISQISAQINLYEN